MSEIDNYPHHCMGIVVCPIRFPLVPGRPAADLHIPIYRIYADAGDGLSFQAKAGDVLLGGGSGETPALRIAIPEAPVFYTLHETHPAWDGGNDLENFVKAYWSMNIAYVLGDGCAKLGWDPRQDVIEHWLAEHVLAFLTREYPDEFAQFLGPEPFAQDGSLCRLPTDDERRYW